MSNSVPKDFPEDYVKIGDWIIEHCYSVNESGHFEIDGMKALKQFQPDFAVAHRLKLLPPTTNYLIKQIHDIVKVVDKDFLKRKLIEDEVAAGVEDEEEDDSQYDSDVEEGLGDENERFLTSLSWENKILAIGKLSGVFAIHGDFAESKANSDTLFRYICHLVTAGVKAIPHQADRAGLTLSGGNKRSARKREQYETILSGDEDSDFKKGFSGVKKTKTDSSSSKTPKKKAQYVEDREELIAITSETSAVHIIVNTELLRKEFETTTEENQILLVHLVENGRFGLTWKTRNGSSYLKPKECAKLVLGIYHRQVRSSTDRPRASSADLEFCVLIRALLYMEVG